jgi:protein TonB
MNGRHGAALLLMAALAACASPALASPPLAIPGTTLTLGMAIARVDSLVAFRIGGRPASPNRRSGVTRYFGLDAATTLEFHANRLAHARFEVADVSTHSRDYVEDQLRRAGLKPLCDRWDADHHECDWDGACNLHLVWDPGKLTVDATPPSSWSVTDSSAAAAPLAARPGASAPDSAAATASPGGGTSVAPSAAPAPTVSSSGSSAGDAHPALAGPAAARASADGALPMLGDTLLIGWPHDVSQVHRARTQVPPDPPVFPAAAKKAGVQGVVRLIATVNARGLVSSTEIVHSIPELDRAAIDAVRACRFVPLGPPGMPQGFRVVAQVRFTQ